MVSLEFTKNHLETYFLYFFSVNVFLFMSAKLVAKSVMPVGNFTAWNMVSSLMARCPLTRPLVEVMILSTPSFLRPAQENMCPEPFSSTWSQV